MPLIPGFTRDGLLPAGDLELSFEELRRSPLEVGPPGAVDGTTCDASWRK